MATTDQIADFINISGGASVEDANKFLALTNFKLEDALNLFFSSGDNHATTSSQGRDTKVPTTTSSSTRSRDDEDYGFIYDDDDDIEEIRAVIPAKRQRLYQNSTEQLLPGVNVPQIDKPVVSVFATGKGHKASSKQEQLAKMYAPPFDIMYKGSFDDMRKQARQSDKWMLVNIQKEDEFSSHILNRDVWSNDSVKELLKFGFLFWQKHDTTSSALDFLQKYKISLTDESFPYIAIVDPVTKSLVKSFKNQANITELLNDFISESCTPSEYWSQRNKTENILNSTSLPCESTTAASSSVSASINIMEGISESKVLGTHNNLVDDETPIVNGFLIAEILKSLSSSPSPISAALDIPSKICNIRLVMPNGQKSKEGFDDGTETTLAQVLKRVIDYIPPEDYQKRIDLYYGYPPIPLSKRLKQSEESDITDNCRVLAQRLQKNIGDLKLNNETVTVRFV